MERVDLIHEQYPKDENGQPRVTGLVLSSHDYREHDCIIHLATPQRIYSFLARGTRRETSKNRRLAMPYSKVILLYDPQYSKDMLFLIRGSLEKQYWKISESLELQVLNAIVVSLIERHGITPEIYEDLEKMWQASDEENLSLMLMYGCLIVCEILKRTGTIMDVDECASCGSTSRIAGISMGQGGFVCMDHLHPELGDQIWPKEKLRHLRWLIKAPHAKIDALKQIPWDWDLFVYLLYWYVYTNDANIKSLTFLKTILNMK